MNKSNVIKVYICLCFLFILICFFFIGKFSVQLFNETQNEALKEVFPGKYNFYIDVPDNYHLWLHTDTYLNSHHYIADSLSPNIIISISDPNTKKEYRLEKTKGSYYKSGQNDSAESLGIFKVEEKKRLLIVVEGQDKPVVLSVTRINIQRMLRYAAMVMGSSFFSIAVGVLAVFLIIRYKKAYSGK